MYDKLQRSRRLVVVQSGCSALSIVKQGDLMVVANVGDSRVVLGTEREMCPWAISKCFGDLVPNTSA
jgi:serine/threonine protein phosphatase PrpC